MERPNLAVVTNALTRRSWSRTARATGVEYEVGGEARTAGPAKSSSRAGPTTPPAADAVGHRSRSAPCRARAFRGPRPPRRRRNLAEHPRVPLEFAAKGPVTFVNQLRFDRAARAPSRSGTCSAPARSPASSTAPTRCCAPTRGWFSPISSCSRTR
jgi:choline dehydrogenase